MTSSHNSLARFFVLSLMLHVALIFSWPNSPAKEKAPEQIPVSFLPAPEDRQAEPSGAPSEPRSRPSRAPARIARKTTPLPEEIAKRPTEPLDKDEKSQRLNQQDLEKNTIVQRPLPTLKELLPPVTWAPSEERTGPVRLETREPKYISYFASIKRAIELVWEYPEPALRHGLQGKLVLEFAILGNGHLEGARLVRSSGVSVLDQEAIRAVKAAAPFSPIPPWIGKSRLEIIASFEYHDNRVKYGFVP